MKMTNKTHKFQITKRMLNNKMKKFKILNKRKKIKKRKNEFNIFIIINIHF